MSIRPPTHIGEVASVAGSIVSVRLRSDVSSNLLLIDGSSYRIGQIGSFYRVPLGYTYLYAVCTAAGAAAVPTRETNDASPVTMGNADPNEHRWLKLALFGESIGDQFQRGVGQYPTIGDEVHVVTPNDMDIIYRHTVVGDATATIPIGSVAGAAGITANLDVAKLVGRHCAVVGSTGTGKSNLVTVLLDGLASDNFPSARVVVVDPHGEYGSALPDQSQLLTIRPMDSDDQSSLVVPFWALPLDELLGLTVGGIPPMIEATIREQVLEMKKQSTSHLANVTAADVTADSPVPFHIGELWLGLDQFEKMTFRERGIVEKYQVKGDADRLIPYQYPAASPHNSPPYKNPQMRNIGRQLDLMVSRLKDPRFSFLFRPGNRYTPKPDGKVLADLDQLVKEWVGHDRPVTIFDVSGMPSEVLQTVVGTMLRIIYDVLFWGQQLPVGGQQQPLLIVVDEAHRFIPKGTTTGAHRTLSMIAKEGRKYGIGLMLVSQRPSEMDPDVISQFGSLIALRISNPTDRAEVAAALPDDLGGLIDLLPSLRTGEAVVIGDVVPIPSRVRIRKAESKDVGADPKLPETWQTKRPDAGLYRRALANWRARSIGNNRGRSHD